MATGKVKWFNNAKGYGFILPEQGGEDLFAHFSTIQMDGYKTLRAGQSVTFDVVTGPKGLHAVNIRAESDTAAVGASTGNGADRSRPPLLAVNGTATPIANGTGTAHMNGTAGAAANGIGQGATA